MFERHGQKISRTNTEYLPSPINDTYTTVHIVDAELPTVTSFKYRHRSRVTGVHRLMSTVGQESGDEVERSSRGDVR